MRYAAVFALVVAVTLTYLHVGQAAVPEPAPADKPKAIADCTRLSGVGVIMIEIGGKRYYILIDCGRPA